MSGGPSPAERARTALHRSPVLAVRSGNRRIDVDQHAADQDGVPLLRVAADHPLVAAVRAAPGRAVPAHADGADLCPLPVADRVRARLRLSGRLTELSTARGRALLRLDVAGVRLESWRAGAGRDTAEVDPAEYAAARPDPIADAEDTYLRHLSRAHPAELALLARLAGAGAKVLPVGLDRFGFVLRRLGGAPTDIRVSFDDPASRLADLQGAVRTLLTRARLAAGQPHCRHRCYH